MTPGQLAKPTRMYLIRNENTGEYLAWKGLLFQLRKGYYWQEGKSGASLFTRVRCVNVMKVLKDIGEFNIKRVLVRK